MYQYNDSFLNILIIYDTRVLMWNFYDITGGHTLGFAHCSSFQNRIHNFNTQKQVDPTLNPSFSASLKGICPANNKAKNAGATMDSSTTAFDDSWSKYFLRRAH